jgi:hypothetical protein
MNLKHLKLGVLFFGLSFFAANSWAMDAEEDEDAAQDSTSETEDATAGSGGNFDPPHDEHSNSTPPQPTHQSGGSATGGASLAEAASDPSSILTMFQNLFWTAGTSDDNNISNTYLLQPVLPLSKANVFRPALPVVNTSGKTGFGDLFLMDLQFIPVKSGTIGLGVAGSVPIGADEFSTNKWQAGPAFVYINKSHASFIAGVLAYNQWSFAGKDSAQSVNLLTGQPIFVKHTSWGYWGWTDQTITYDWKNNLSSVPLGLRIGNVVHWSKMPVTLIGCGQTPDKVRPAGKFWWSCRRSQWECRRSDRCDRVCQLSCVLADLANDIRRRNKSLIALCSLG